MVGGNLQVAGMVFATPACRSVWTYVLPGDQATYNTETVDPGWYNIKSTDDKAYVYFGHGDKWDTANEGVEITQNETITRYIDQKSIGYYTDRGYVRLERIEFVKLLED